MPAPRSTGLSGVDAQHDFLRARRSATVARLVARLRGEPDDVGVILPYSEVIDALGFVSERPFGLKVVTLDEIVGTIDRGRDFDRRFRPTSARVRSRWEQIAAAMRRGEAMPPVELLKVGDIYFVRDGHHRVSVARALGRTDIDAYVTDVITRVDATATINLTDLPLKSHERVFFERVPLREDVRSEIDLSDRGTSRYLARRSRRGAFGRCGRAMSCLTARRPRNCGWRPSTAPWSQCCATPT